MKRLLVSISILCIVMLAQSQNTVVTKDGELIEGKIKSYLSGKLIFQEPIEVLNSNFIEIDQVLEIHGPMLKIKKSGILKMNPKVRFFNELNEEITPEEIAEQEQREEYQDPLYYEPEPRTQTGKQQMFSNSKEISLESKVAYELAHTRNCLMNYRREKLTGIWMTIGGGVIAGASISMYNNGDLSARSAAIGYLGGGIMVLAGEIMQLTCNKWLKMASFGPTENGVGLKVRF